MHCALDPHQLEHYGRKTHAHHHHTREAGTLIDGTSRGDGNADVLKATGWRWGRSIGTWYVPNNRDHLPNES